jgi:type II secretory pathway pseudopilin PulG
MIVRKKRRCRGKGRFAFTLIELLCVLGIIMILVSLMIPAVQNARESARRIACSNKTRQVGIAIHNFESAFRRLPPGHEGQNDRFPFQTWIPKLLPYLEQRDVAEDIDSAYRISRNPFDQTVHQRFAFAMPSFACPSDSRVSESQISRGISVALTSYVGVNGTNYQQKDGIFFFQSRIRLSDVSDGLSNTFAVIERPPSADSYFGWWYAGAASTSTGALDSSVGTSDLNSLSVGVVGANCARGPFRMQRRKIQDAQCGIFHPWSLHDVVYVLHVDGSVDGLSYDISPAVLSALSTRAGGEVNFQGE